MQKYSFTAPNGEKFSVSVPNGYSQAQAKAVFDQQYNQGALKTLGVGQSLTGVAKSVANTAQTVQRLANVAVQDPIKAAQLLLQPSATQAIGSLGIPQVTGLLAQAKQYVNQGSAVVSAAKGVGQFGFSPQQLESLGFLKSGTVANFLGNNPNADVTKLLSSTTVWTGKDGVSGLNSFLSNTNIQNISQQNLLSSSFSQLKNLGVLNGSEGAQQLSGVLQAASKFGVTEVAKWTQGLGSANLVGSIANLAKGAQFATSVVGALGGLFGGGRSSRTVTPASNTVNRAAVDAAVKAFLGNAKIPAPVFGPLRRQ